MNCAWVSSESRSMSQNCAGHCELLQTCSILDTPWNFRGVIRAPLSSHTVLVGPVPKGRWRLSWTNRLKDENWARSYEPNLKRLSNEWKHPGSSRPIKVRPTHYAVKVMFIVAYDINGVILHHAVSPKLTVNAAFNCMFLQHHIRLAISGKRRHLVVQNPSIILHDNARRRTAAIMDLWRRWQWEILVHLRYSHDMSPLFAKAKESLSLWGTRYNTREELIHSTGRSKRNINEDRCADVVRRLPNIWKIYINKEATIVKVHKCCTPVNKDMSEIYNFCHYFLCNPCK